MKIKIVYIKYINFFLKKLQLYKYLKARYVNVKVNIFAFILNCFVLPIFII